jgi:hypothetical protein
MPSRSRLFPTSLLSDEAFIRLSPLQQNLVFKLWLSPHLDSAGFHPLQIRKLARSFTPQSTEADMAEVVASVGARGWIAADEDTEEVFLRPIIRMDAAKQPQIYVAACRAIQAAQSRKLRQVAWEQVLIVHPPPLKPDPKRTQDTTDRLVTQQNLAYEELRRFMEASTEPFGNPSRRVAERSVVVTDTGTDSREEKGASADLNATINGAVEMCSLCGERAARKLPHSWRPDLCGFCVEQLKHPSMRQVVDGDSK